MVTIWLIRWQRQKILLEEQIEALWIYPVLHYAEALLMRAEQLLVVKLAHEYFLVHQFGPVGMAVACMVAVKHGVAEIWGEQLKDFVRQD